MLLSKEKDWCKKITITGTESKSFTYSFESCAFYRGISPEECYMSGLGLYKLQKNTNQNKSVSEMFDLPQEPLSKYLNNILKEDNWSTIDWSEDTEFLRMNPPFSKKYWKLESDKISDVSLARYGTPIKIYVFIDGIMIILSSNLYLIGY